ncbi:BspA family leucine-rich repeat surface protein [Actinomycetaceae bacterium MB13-C1-2]|nr:BspA family leucine-rich repeat surface protein [Actinomycetaceae bacterium MB13-C1-2]
MPTQAPTLDPEVFGSNAFKWWQGEVLEGTMLATPGVSFVVTETGLVMDAKWSSALQLWGEAPWQFDAATGTLTVYGSDDPANPRTLGRYYASPWETGSVPPADIKTIILENPTGIAFPAESGLLFSSNGYGDEPVNLTRIEGISEVNTSGVTLMWGMFWGAESLESLDLSGWETSGVDDMSNLFRDTASLTSLDVSTWETAQVTNMDHLFRGASALESLDLSNWDTTGASKWNMFEDASSLESLTLGPKTVLSSSGLPGVNNTDIFTGKWVRTGPAPSSTEAWWSGDSDELIERSEDLATVAGTYIWQRKAPVTLDLNHGDWPGAAPDLDALGVAGVGDLVTLPVDVPVLNGFEFDSWGTDPADPDRTLGAGDSFVVTEPGLVLTAQWDPPLQLWGEAPWKFDASSGTLFVYGDAANPRTLGGYPASPWNRADTSRVDPAGIEKIVFEDPEGIKLPVGSNYLFSAISALDFLANLTEIEGISQVDTTEVMFMAGMFSGASSLEALDLSGWDTGNVELMNSMFLGTDKLSSLTFGDKWDTSSVASMSSMFNGASSLEALDLSGWDTGSVQEMNYMFLGTDKLSSLTLGDTSRLASSADLPGVPSGISSDYTGKWVRTETSPSLTTAWWSGSSDKLILQSQDQTDAAGTYVWQQKAPVALDLNHGAWSDPVPNLDAFASAGVGDSLTLPVDVPVLNGFEFDSWGPNPADPDGTLSAGDSFVVTEPGLVLTAQWDPPLRLWGEAPWKFDTASGTVTVYGSGDSANPRILGTESQAPWHTVGSGFGPRDVEKIVFEDPESIKLPADSESLFSSRTGFPLENLRGISGIGQVNTSEVSNPRGMFSFASSLESLDLSGWDTTGFTNTEFMFSGASSLESLDLSGWVLDGDYQESLFIGASSLASLTLGADTKFAATVALRDAPDGAPYTGKWVRTGPDPSSTEAWWSGDSDELIERSQNSATAAGTYVWQMSTPVTLDFTGGSWSPGAAPDLSSIDNAAVGRLLTLPTDVPELIGYTFDGWQMSQATTRVAGMGLLDWVMAQARGAIGELGAAGSLHPGDSFVVSAPGAITLTAQWEEDVPPPAELTLSFDLGGGAAGGGVFDPITGLVEGETLTLPASVPVRDGFAFAGWWYNDLVFNAGAEFTMPDADVTLVAQWGKVPIGTVAVTFDLNGGAGVFDPLVGVPGSMMNLPSDVPTRDGHEFEGWLHADTTYQPGAEFTMPDVDVTLVAQWREVEPPPPAEFSLLFDLGGGAAGGGVFDPITGLVEGELVTLPTDVPVRDGFAFTGWWYNDQVFNAGVEFTMPDADATLVAQWREVNQPPLPPGPPNPPVDPGAGGDAGANPALPDTGANAAPVAIGGALLLVMGAVAAALSRRRRN